MNEYTKISGYDANMIFYTCTYYKEQLAKARQMKDDAADLRDDVKQLSIIKLAEKWEMTVSKMRWILFNNAPHEDGELIRACYQVHIESNAMSDSMIMEQARIRREIKHLSQMHIARAYNVSHSTVSDIVREIIWVNSHER